MSRENVEVVRRMFDANWAGDVETALSLIDPQLEWDLTAYPLPDWPTTGRGRDEFVSISPPTSAAGVNIEPNCGS